MSRVGTERVIRRMLQSDCRGVDRLDAALTSLPYHDAWDGRGALHSGPASLVAGKVVERLARDTERTVHFLGDLSFEFHDEIAFVES
jgi:hypothetical protein